MSCYRANADGREQILRVFERPGDTFCIASAFSTGIHIVSARSVTRTRLLLLDVLTVKRVAEEHPAFAVSLLGAAGQQMGTLVELAESLALKTATARLAKLLYELARGEGAPAGRDILVHRDRLREEEIAAIDDGVAAFDHLLAQLADVPTPAGPTPIQLRPNELIQLQPTATVKEQ